MFSLATSTDEDAEISELLPLHHGLNVNEIVIPDSEIDTLQHITYMTILKLQVDIISVFALFYLGLSFSTHMFCFVIGIF